MNNEVIQLGAHRLLCGDATNKEDVQKLVGNNTVNLLLTDPPYGINIVNTQSDGGGGKVSPQYKYPSEQFRKSRTPGRSKHHPIQEKEGEREHYTVQSEEPNPQHSKPRGLVGISAKPSKQFHTHTHLMTT